MNENKIAVEQKENTSCGMQEIDCSTYKNETFRDVTSPIIAEISVFMLVFAVILAVTVSLLNAEITPSGITGNFGSDNGGTIMPPSQSQSKIEDNRDKPSLPSYVNAPENANAYRPKDSANALQMNDVSSKAALLVDLSSGEVVAQKSLDTPLPIASMTKVMTLIVACDYITSSDMMFATVELKYSKRLDGYNKVFLNTNHGIEKESVYVVDMLYGLILFSGADCAYGLAEGFAGSEKAFVQKMNEKAKAIGMNDTTFTNCVGKDDEGKNVSTVRDTATMFTYALKNPLCRAILTAQSWVCVGKYKLPSMLWYQGTIPSNVHEKIEKRCGSVNVLGGKSGHEDMALYCLVSLARNDQGKEYVCVTAGHPSSSYADTQTIYKNYAE